MNKFLGMLLTFSTFGCGPHHVTTIQVAITRYQCVNWFQTIAMCETLDECNKVCAQAAGRAPASSTESK